jgi:CubicO group peptidase (beta-lactamase class C family)
MVIVYSATKGLAAMTLAIAHSRGWLDYDERVCTYWPEFAQQGKERITVRQLLAHQAGLYALDEPVTRELVADLDRLAMLLARQRPAWEPGTRQAYHAITLGFYESELLRRVDPQHRSVGRFFQDEIATPLGLDVYIRLPEEIPDSRLATIARPRMRDMVFGFPARLLIDTFNRQSKIVRALRGSELPHDAQHVYARNLEVPSGGAVGTARAIAHAYSAFATGGHELGLRAETLALLAAPATPPTHGFRDECLHADAQFSLGFMKPSAALPFGGASSYGSPGAGGAMGFADPHADVGYAYVTSQMGTRSTPLSPLSRARHSWRRSVKAGAAQGSAPARIRGQCHAVVRIDPHRTGSNRKRAASDCGRLARRAGRVRSCAWSRLASIDPRSGRPSGRAGLIGERNCLGLWQSIQCGDVCAVGGAADRSGEPLAA